MCCEVPPRANIHLTSACPPVFFSALQWLLCSSPILSVCLSQSVCMFASDLFRLLAPGLSYCDRAPLQENKRLLEGEENITFFKCSNEVRMETTHAHDIIKYGCSTLVFEFPLWSLEWSAFTVAMLVKIPKKPSVDSKCYSEKRTRKRDHIFPILASIHWHPVISNFEFNWTLLLSLPFSYSLP